MWMLSATCLYLTAFLCVIGILDEDILDNLLERVGMGILVLGCMGRAKYVVESQMVDPTWIPVHAGMAVYAAGGAFRIALRRLRLNRNPTIARIDAWLLVRRTAQALKRDAARLAKHEAMLEAECLRLSALVDDGSVQRIDPHASRF